MASAYSWLTWRCTLLLCSMTIRVNTSKATSMPAIANRSTTTVLRATRTVCPMLSKLEVDKGISFVRGEKGHRQHHCGGIRQPARGLHLLKQKLFVSGLQAEIHQKERQRK